jgi:hypothetical protein
MNSESLILEMGEEVIFAHNQMTEFLSNTSFNTNSLFSTMVILKMNIANPIHMDQAKHPPTSHPFPLSMDCSRWA